MAAYCRTDITPTQPITGESAKVFMRKIENVKRESAQRIKQIKETAKSVIWK
ncbi:MAG: hypothetical protein J5651_00190 [Salinivirgaceae bacterium]|nr:hypothetical protein [Salinivirgaceae bacterium]